VWDWETGHEDLALHPPQFAYGIAFSPDGKRLALACADAIARVWDITTRREVAVFRGHKSAVSCVAFNPDGRRIASGGDDHTVKVWEAATGREALTLRGHSGTVFRVAFSPDGHRIASASRDGTIKIWDGTPWRERAVGDLATSQANESH
jgi:WD40 repeat protein